MWSAGLTRSVKTIGSFSEAPVMSSPGCGIWRKGVAAQLAT